MRKAIFTGTFLSFLLIIGFQDWVFTNRPAPPAGNTGAPGEDVCSNATCHGSNSGSGSVDITFDNPDGDLYLNDSTYQLTIEVTDGSQSRFGFQITALDEVDEMAGSFNLIDGNTSSSSESGRDYVGHNNADATNSWDVEWTAPGGNVGNITFYAAGNAADGNGTNTGDIIYTTSHTVEPDDSIVNFLQAQNEVGAAWEVYPNPATSYLTLSYELPQPGYVKATLLNLQGQTVQVLHEGREASGSGQQRVQLERARMPAGMYVLRFEQGNRSSHKKIWVQ